MDNIEVKPKKFKAKKFTTVDALKVEWLWEPFIALGDVTIVQGDGMSGKTTAMIRLACMVSNGEVPPAVVHGELKESGQTEPANVLYVSVEAKNETEIKPIIEYSHGDPDHLYFLDQDEDQFVLTEEDVRAAIDATQCKMMIIDPYTQFLPDGISLANAVSMRQLLSMLMRVARDTGTAIVLIGHLNKSQYGKQIYAGYGSVDITNTSRSVLLVSRDEFKNRYLSILKTNYYGVDDYFKVGLSMDDQNCIQFVDYGYLYESSKQDAELDEATYKPALIKSQSAQDRCMDAIAEVLNDGPMTKGSVIEALLEKEFAQRTIERAFKNMGGIYYYDNRVCYWKLPETDKE